MNEVNKVNEGDEGDVGDEGDEGDEGDKVNEGDEGDKGDKVNEGDEGDKVNEGDEGGVGLSAVEKALLHRNGALADLGELGVAIVCFPLNPKPADIADKYSWIEEYFNVLPTS